MNKPLKLTLLSLLLCVGVMESCNENNADQLHRQEIAYPYQIVTIDGCQYIDNRYRADIPLVHKGNCNNPIHTTH